MKKIRTTKIPEREIDPEVMDAFPVLPEDARKKLLAYIEAWYEARKNRLN